MLIRTCQLGAGTSPTVCQCVCVYVPLLRSAFAPRSFAPLCLALPRLGAETPVFRFGDFCFIHDVGIIFEGRAKAQNRILLGAAVRLWSDVSYVCMYVWPGSVDTYTHTVQYAGYAKQTRLVMEL